MQTTMSRYMGAVILIASLPMACSASGATRVLRFPADQYLGRLSVEDPCLGSECFEFSRDLSYPFGFDPKCVRLAGDWDFVALAQGDVTVPAGRNVQLNVSFGYGPEDAAQLARLPARRPASSPVWRPVHRSPAPRPASRSGPGPPSRLPALESRRPGRPARG